MYYYKTKNKVKKETTKCTLTTQLEYICEYSIHFFLLSLPPSILAGDSKTAPAFDEVFLKQ